MFIYTLRGSTVKFFGILLLSVIALVAVLALVPTYQPTAVSITTNVSFENVKTNEERISFLSADRVKALLERVLYSLLLAVRRCFATRERAF